jgi:hypothetical protein
VEMGTTTMKRSLGNASLDHTRWNSEVWNKTKTTRALAKEGTSCQHMLEANHDGLHTNDGIQWRGYSELSHEGSWSYMKTFETCVKSIKSIRRVIPHKATLMMCGTNEGIAKRRCKPSIIENCLLSTPRDHPRWEARRPRYKLTSQDTFGAHNISLIYLWFISNCDVDLILCLVLMMIMIG